MNNSSDNIILDFCDKQAVDNWEAIDDRIMGGCSQSQPAHINNIGLRFTGTVSLVNNGGFASIRSKTADYDLSAATGVTLRVKGDGKNYKLSLRTDSYYDGISYQAEFETHKDAWQEIKLPFNTFKPTHHGLKLTTAAPMESSRIQSFGLFIANRQEGPFQLDVAWIKQSIPGLNPRGHM